METSTNVDTPNKLAPVSLQKLASTTVAHSCMKSKDVNQKLCQYLPRNIADDITLTQIRLNCCLIIPFALRYIDRILVTYLDIGYIVPELYHLLFSPSRLHDHLIFHSICYRCLHIILSPHLYLNLSKRYQHLHDTFNTDDVSRLLFKTYPQYASHNIVRRFIIILEHQPHYHTLFRNIPLCLKTIEREDLCTIPYYNFHPSINATFMYYQNHPQLRTKCSRCSPVFQRLISQLHPTVRFFTINDNTDTEEEDSSSDDNDSISLLVNIDLENEETFDTHL